MKTDTLNQLRQHIDLVDQELVQLLNKRAELAIKTAENKALDAIYSPERESQVLKNIIAHNNGPLCGRAMENVFSGIIHECRHLQHQLQTDKQRTRIAVQGLAASFSEGAALQYCRDNTILSPQLTYCVSSHEVMQALNTQQTQLGIMAINNDQGGLVEETLSALNQESYQVIDTVAFLVEQNLLTAKPCDLASIKTVYSHSQAIRQCHDFIKQTLNHCQLIEVADTALAAKELAAGRYGSQAAVIASSRAAEHYELTINQSHIQNLEHNITLFLVIEKRKTP